MAGGEPPRPQYYAMLDIAGQGLTGFMPFFQLLLQKRTVLSTSSALLAATRQVAYLASLLWRTAESHDGYCGGSKAAARLQRF